MTWFVFFLIVTMASFALAFGSAVVGAIRDSRGVFVVFSACFLCGVASAIATITTGAWTLAAWITR